MMKAKENKSFESFYKKDVVSPFIVIKCFYVLLVTTFLYYVLLVNLGYEYVKYISTISTPFLFYFLINKHNIYAYILFSIIFLVIFDNDILNWTEYKIRPWYFLILITYFFIYPRKNINNIIFKIKSKASFLILAYFIVISLLFFVIEEMQSKLYIIKYWLFSIGLIHSLLFLFKVSKLSAFEILSFWFFTVMFSTLWGLLQFIGNIYGFAGDFLQHDWYNINPSAFFSERTWYGQYSAIGIILSTYFLKKTKQKIVLIVIAIGFIGVAISYSRSSLVPLLAGFFAFIISACVTFRIKKNHFAYFMIFLVITFVINSFKFMEDLTLFSLFDKFKTSDVGLQGRFEAFDMFLSNINNNPIGYIFGNGFYWDESEASSIGTAVGAKSANVFLMIWHIFGIFGLLLSITIALYFTLRYVMILKINNSSEVILGFVLWLSFLWLSFTVPAHQYPPNLMILFFSILIFREFDLCKIK